MEDLFFTLESLVEHLESNGFKLPSNPSLRTIFLTQGNSEIQKMYLHFTRDCVSIHDHIRRYPLHQHIDCLIVSEVVLTRAKRGAKETGRVSFGRKMLYGYGIPYGC